MCSLRHICSTVLYLIANIHKNSGALAPELGLTLSYDLGSETHGHVYESVLSDRSKIIAIIPICSSSASSIEPTNKT